MGIIVMHIFCILKIFILVKYVKYYLKIMDCLNFLGLTNYYFTICLLKNKACFGDGREKKKVSMFSCFISTMEHSCDLFSPLYCFIPVDSMY